MSKFWTEEYPRLKKKARFALIFYFTLFALAFFCIPLGLVLSIYAEIKNPLGTLDNLWFVIYFAGVFLTAIAGVGIIKIWPHLDYRLYVYYSFYKSAKDLAWKPKEKKETS